MLPPVLKLLSWIDNWLHRSEGMNFQVEAYSGLLIRIVKIAPLSGTDQDASVAHFYSCCVVTVHFIQASCGCYRVRCNKHCANDLHRTSCSLWGPGSCTPSCQQPAHGRHQ